MIDVSAANLADLCLVTAVDIEFKLAVELLLEKAFHVEAGMKVCRGRLGSRRITVLQSEMGAVGFDERLAKHLANNRYDALIVTGLAGGLDPKLRAGEAVIYDLCGDARADENRSDRGNVASIACDHWLSQFLFEALKASGSACVRGSGVTAGRIIAEATDKLSLGARYNAAAIDMETYGVLGVCARFNLPAAALRVISDEAGQDLPDFNRAYGADGRMNGWRMAAAMMARPLAALRFLLGIRRALRSLKESLKAVLIV